MEIKIKIKMHFLLSQDNRKYDVENLKNKFKEKSSLQNKYEMTENKKSFVVWYTQDLRSKYHSEDLIKAFEWCLTIWMQVVLFASAEHKFQEPIEKLYENFSKQITILDQSDENEKDILAMSDASIFLNQDDTKIFSSLSYACIPLYLNVENNNKIINNFNPLSEKWNWFLIESSSYWHIFSTIIRAYETYRFPYDWENLKRQCIDSSRVCNIFHK